MASVRAKTDYEGARKAIMKMVAASSITAEEASEMLAQVQGTEAMDRVTAREEGKGNREPYNVADDKTCGDVLEHNGYQVSIGSYRGAAPSLRVKVGLGAWSKAVKPSLAIVDWLRGLDNEQYDKLLGSARHVQALVDANTSAAAKNKARETPAANVAVPDAVSARVDTIADNVAQQQIALNQLTAGMSQILAALGDTAKKAE